MYELIPDGYDIVTTIQPESASAPLQITYRPCTQLEYLAHMDDRSAKSGAERHRCRLEWLARYIKAWTVKGNPPVNADSLNRLHSVYYQSVENLIMGFAVDPGATVDEKKS